MSENQPSDWPTWLVAENDSIKSSDRWRSPRSFDAIGPVGVLNGQTVVSFASNDYLGLTSHPAVKAAAQDAIDHWGTGSGASRLVVGSRPIHHDLEKSLARWRGTESAVLFPTGFAANLGLLATLGGRDVVIHSDELNHASIIDGCRMARSNGAEVLTYPHLDLETLAANMESHSDARQVVVTDSVFSMDGDVAPITQLAELCARFSALLILDEAHSVLEPIPPPQLSGTTIVQVGTLSKTLGALGGFVAGPTALVDLLVNRARTYIFTTAPSPADSAAALAAIEILQSDEGAALRDRLRSSVDRIRPNHTSPIIPIVLGDEAAALRASQQLLERGLLVPAIRPPTVPVGSSRLRVALSAAHTDEQIDALLDALNTLETDGGR
ncbi:MAG: 8-amino-7-oxononanoate synthase [Acidimicrobiia bacterium]|nr:8-amino-7-oxononanoate synthase [Acidimicrobiia bacterium]